MAESTTELAVRDKVVVITGAARGLGQEFARSLAAAGALVVAADINDCSATLDLIEAENGKAISVALDVRSAESASDMTNAATRAFGRGDALISNAALYGAFRRGRFGRPEAAASSISPRLPRPTACRSRCTIRLQKRR